MSFVVCLFGFSVFLVDDPFVCVDCVAGYVCLV